MSAVVRDLRAEYRPEALGIGVAAPRLSWRIEGSASPQASVEVRRLATSVAGEEVARLDDEQVLVEWPFTPLESRQRVEVTVRAALADGTLTEWSEPLAVEAALLDDDDWEVDFVSPSPRAPQEGVRPGHLLRTGFALPAGFVAARVYATAHGLYRLELNGTRVGSDELAPGWTSYAHRLRYQTYDVTGLLRAGENAIGAELSDGWYRGRIGFHGGIWDNYGSDVALLLQLEVEHADGRREVVPLHWRAGRSPVLAASLYDGERYDARLLPTGWSSAGFDDVDWTEPAILPRTSYPHRLEAAVGVPVREIEELDPVAIERRPDGRIRLDFGQNIAGRLRIRVAGESGRRIRLHHAEVLENDELAIRPLRGAPSIDEYVLAGDAEETWSPRFTIHGFRYAEVEGWPGDVAPGAIRAVVVHSDMQRTGWFDTDHALVSRLHENTVWSMRDNFVDLPTDCPQRDERLGWTGDIQVFAPAAAFLYSSGGTLASWLKDVAAEQDATGAVPNFVPWIECGFPKPSSAAWGDAAVVVPWTMYERSRDRGVLAAQYDSMRAWVEHSRSKADGTGIIRTGMELGDWLDPAAPPDDPGAGRTDKYLVATAYLVRSAALLARAAEVLGRTADVRAYVDLSAATRAAFRREYLRADGELSNETPTSLSLAIEFGLLDDGERAAAGKRLAELVRAGGYRVQTGFVGTPLICDALADTGQTDVAYRLLLERDCPSWLYPVTMGATTVWERWDSMLPDGSVNPGEMTSFNHYALGAVVDFLHRVLAGLAPLEPGYRRVRIAPRPGDGFGEASARHDSAYGTIAVAWRRSGDRIELDVELPNGVTGELVLPDGSAPRELSPGRQRIEFEAAARDAAA